MRLERNRRRSILLAFFLSLALTSSSTAWADSPEGPKLISGAPLRHALVSCATNKAQALTCIQSVSVVPKPGVAPVAGAITGRNINTELDGRIADSERPVYTSSLTPDEISKLEVKVLISNPECCHDPNVALSLEKFVDGKWVALTSRVNFYTRDPDAPKLNKPSVSAATLLTVTDAQKYFPEIPTDWNLKSKSIVYDKSKLRFKLDSGSWQWFSSSDISLSPENGAPKITVSRGVYDEWSFPKATGVAASPIVVYSDFQPYKATWCWNENSCSSNREEYVIYLKSSLGADTWKDNKDISYVVTIRAPKSFSFGEVSGSSRNTIVKYGKDLPDFNGVPMREIISTLAPIATARSRQLAGGPPEEKAYGITYDANINIFGMQNDITQFLGPCASLGSIQVLSNAMHSIDPVWDPVTETIKVRLETPHFAPDGSLNTGYLEIRIPRESALCMWKLDLDGSIKASVSVTYEDGSAPSIATVVGKRIDDDYLIITSGFHFSSPNIAVKIVKGTQTANPEPAISPVAAFAKKVTITCIKGDTSKKVTAVKPTCPAGFKKK